MAELADDEDGPTDDWVDGEWQDPCEDLAPCKAEFENDPCADITDLEEYEQCHKDNPEWADNLEACLDDKTDEDWEAEMQCWL